MAGMLSTNSTGGISHARADIDINVTFDQAVTMNLGCSETGDAPIGFAGTTISINANPVAEANLSCGNSLQLSAGTYDILFVSHAVTNFGGSAMLDFDNVLTVTAVPIPASVWLFGSALAGLGWMRRKRVA